MARVHNSHAFLIVVRYCSVGGLGAKKLHPARIRVYCMGKKRNKKGAPAEEKWVSFARMGSIRQPDDLIEGYCIPLDGKEFRLFVMEELTGTKRGYILKLMLGWGDDTTIDLQRQRKSFPEATNLMNLHIPDAWVNKGKTRRCYKYMTFGKGEQNKALALALLRTIVCELKSMKGDKQ